MKKQAVNPKPSPKGGFPGGIWPLFMVSFLEGGALMAVELLAAKLVAPYYGNSIYVWSAVLGTTLGGLAIGYYLGGLLAGGSNARRWLQRSLLASVFVTALLPLSSTGILSLSMGIDQLQAGIILSCFLILTPPLLLFGMVSPLVIRLAAPTPEASGRATGLVYGISTLGGIMATFLYAFQLMPYWGLRVSCWITAALLLCAVFFSLWGNIRSLVSKH